MKPDYTTIGIVLASIFFLLQVASLVITLWHRLQRKPPIDQTLLNYVQRNEFADHCKQNETVMAEVFSLLRDQQTTAADSMTGLRRDLADWQRAISYQIGSLDGRIDKIERKHNNER